MNTDKKREIDKITEMIIGCSLNVSNVLGPGFCEKVYENALAWEFNQHSLAYVKQKKLIVYYHSIIVGEFTPDFIINEVVIVELKAPSAIDPSHEAQLRTTSKLRI
ncbi:MAG: GxxExxY protein [Acidobacteria bacterium]|nr:MAG: GxxExxY protein [Acidobacteriota bacterium]